MRVNKTTLILVGIILLILALAFFGARYYQNKIKEAELEKRTAVIRSDSLVKVSEGLYRKMVADTLKIKDLEKIVKDLGIKLDAKPKIVEVIKFRPRPVQDKPVDEVVVKDDSISIVDYYPAKENYAIKYSNKLSIGKKSGLSTWNFKPIQISIVISERKDGIFTSTVKVPEWIEVESVDIQATPMTIPKIDNFGILIGASYGKSFKEGQDDFIRLSGGIRYKRIYLDLGGSTNQTVDIGLKYEL